MALTAQSRLEILQVFKLLQSVVLEDTAQISKLCAQGIPMLINYRDPHRGECALHLAAQLNNEKVTKFLINLGAFPNVQDFQGRTPIMRAADYGHEKAVESLVGAGADLKLKDNVGQDVITYCFSSTTKRHQRCLEIAISNGAEANNTMESDTPTLVAACMSAVENEGVCMTLIEHGANPNATNKLNGRTALSAACASGSAVVARALLQKGANPNIRDRKQMTPVHLAAEAGALDIIKPLAAFGADLSVSDKEHNNPLHLAAEGGFGMVCKFLSQRGCNPKLKNVDGFTPRLLAKEKSFKEASKELRKAEKLFTKYSKPEATNPNPPDLLFFYDWVCEREIFIREALMNTIQPSDEAAEKKPPIVTQQDFLTVMKRLQAPMSEELEKQITEAHHDPEVRGTINVDEFLSGKKYVSKAYLMSAFEKKKKKGKKGKKGGKGKKGKFKIPLPICIDQDGPRRPDGGPPKKYLERSLHYCDLTQFDRDHPPPHPVRDDSGWYLPNPDKQYVIITDAVKVEDLMTLRQAFESGADVDLRDKYFKTPLMASCAEGNLELTKYFIQLGANVEARDNFKWTPLHHACHSGQLDVVQVLLFAGADGNAVTWNGATPLMRAIESGKPELVRYLLSCNVNVMALNKKEKSAVDIARDWGNAEIYEMVKEKYEAAPKPKKDKKGNLRMPPAPQITIPGLNKNENGLLPGIASADNFEQAMKPNLRPTSAQRWPMNKMKLELPKKQKEVERGERRTVVDFSLENYNRGEREVKDNIMFNPKKAWLEQPSTQQVTDAKQEKRIRFGEMIDFDDYEKPLKQNMTKTVNNFDTET